MKNKIKKILAGMIMAASIVSCSHDAFEGKDTSFPEYIKVLTVDGDTAIIKSFAGHNDRILVVHKKSKAEN